MFKAGENLEFHLCLQELEVAKSMAIELCMGIEGVTLASDRHALDVPFSVLPLGTGRKSSKKEYTERGNKLSAEGEDQDGVAGDVQGESDNCEREEGEEEGEDLGEEGEVDGAVSDEGMGEGEGVVHGPSAEAEGCRSGAGDHVSQLRASSVEALQEQVQCSPHAVSACNRGACYFCLKCESFCSCILAGLCNHAWGQSGGVTPRVL